MNSAARDARDSAKDGAGLSKAMMFGLVILAVVASVLMLFLDSEMWLRIAVIAALWSAFLGLFLVSRYSGQLAAQRRRTQALEESQQARIAEVENAGRLRAAELERDYQQRLTADREALRDENLESLRQELAALRAQLSLLTGESFENEQVAVRGRAERIVELERGSHSRGGASAAAMPGRVATPSAASAASPSVPGRVASQPQPQSPSQPPAQGAEPGARRVPGFSTGSFAAIRFAGQDAEETSQIPLVVDTSSISRGRQERAASATSATPQGATSGVATPSATTASAGARTSAGASPAASATPSGTASAAGTGSRYGAGAASSAVTGSGAGSRTASVGATSTGSTATASAAAQAEKAQPAEAAAAKAARSSERHGRRRVDESQSGLTVAELMSRFKGSDK